MKTTTLLNFIYLRIQISQFIFNNKLKTLIIMKKIYMILFALMAVLTANATDYYLVGGGLGWSTTDYKFSETTTTGVYELSFTGTLTSGFKIYDGADWSTVNIGANSTSTLLTPGVAYSYAEGSGSGNITLSEAIANPTLTLNTNDKTLTVVGAAAQVTVTYKLNGSFEDGSAWKDVTLTEADGVFSATVTAKVDAAFKVVSLNDGAEGEWYGSTNASITAEADNQTITLSTTGGNISIAAGTYNISVKKTDSALTLTVSAVGSTGIAKISSEISADAPAFNIAGQRVNKGTKGLVIVGGKKYLNK